MNGKKKGEKKEVLMIITVVVLAFGLTVTGIIYLTKSLIGPDTPARPVTQAGSVVIVPDNTMPVENSGVSAQNVPVTTMPVQTTPPTQTTAPVQTAPVQTTPPAQTTTPPRTTPPAQTTPPVQATAPRTQPAIPADAFLLQFSSFRSEENAQNEMKRYLPTCSDMFVTKVELANGVWYRVRGCQAANRERANATKALIKQQYGVDTLVVSAQ